MTLFEYLAIAFGLLYSVAALASLADYRSPRTAPAGTGCTSPDVPHPPGHRVGILDFWAYREVDWTFPRFLLALTVPGIWYYSAAVLVPENWLAR